MTKNLMELNRETAMRLWVKSFGKQTKAVDFAGREIAKGAYNDRNSQYGWNVDHVLPQSKGGTTADYNLVCCNIQTNDEKADKFPCFYANGHRFEIIKVQRHYEIRAVSEKKDKPAEKEKPSSANANPEDTVNFYDSASGIRFFKKLKGIQNKKCFVGYVLIRLQNLQNTAVVDFIKEIFDAEQISFSSEKVNYYSLMSNNNEVDVRATNYNMPLKEDTQNLLNKCILLNTYLGSYIPQDCVGSYEIYYAVKYYENKMDMYKDNNIFGTLPYPLKNTLYINDLVIQNTDAKNKITIHDGFNKYDYVYTQLQKNLIKEVEGK